MIKSLTPDDVAVVLKLQHQTPSRNWSADEVEKLLSRDWITAFGLKVARTFMGLCVLKVIDNEAEILEFVIDKRHRKKGRAQHLWLYVKEQFPNAAFFLEVSEHNTPAIKFYEKMGFTQIHIRPNYYGPNDSALIYKL